MQIKKNRSKSDLGDVKHAVNHTGCMSHTEVKQKTEYPLTHAFINPAHVSFLPWCITQQQVLVQSRYEPCFLVSSHFLQVSFQYPVLCPPVLYSCCFLSGSSFIFQHHECNFPTPEATLQILNIPVRKWITKSEQSYWCP